MQIACCKTDRLIRGYRPRNGLTCDAFGLTGKARFLPDQFVVAENINTNLIIYWNAQIGLLKVDQEIAGCFIRICITDLETVQHLLIQPGSEDVLPEKAD